MLYKVFQRQHGEEGVGHLVYRYTVQADEWMQNGYRLGRKVGVEQAEIVNMAHGTRGLQQAGAQDGVDIFQDGGITLGFPYNQFETQDSGDDREIAEFCQLNCGVSFPVIEKIAVNGLDSHPLYPGLCAEAPGPLGTKAIKRNFTNKVLNAKNGSVLKRYAPKDTAAGMTKDIEAALALWAQATGAPASQTSSLGDHFVAKKKGDDSGWPPATFVTAEFLPVAWPLGPLQRER